MLVTDIRGEFGGCVADKLLIGNDDFVVNMYILVAGETIELLEIADADVEGCVETEV